MLQLVQRIGRKIALGLDFNLQEVLSQFIQMKQLLKVAVDVAGGAEILQTGQFVLRVALVRNGGFEFKVERLSLSRVAHVEMTEGSLKNRVEVRGMDLHRQELIRRGSSLGRRKEIHGKEISVEKRHQLQFHFVRKLKFLRQNQ